MIGESKKIGKDGIYRIRNRKSNLYLTSGAHLSMEPKGQNRPSQLWLIDEVKPEAFVIVSLKLGTALTRAEQVIIEKQSKSPHQLWQLRQAEIAEENNYYWIVDNDDEDNYLCFSSVSKKLLARKYDRTLFITNWSIEAVDINRDLAGCCIFRSVFSDLAIDVPDGSNKEGAVILQSACTGRGNQRWVIENVINCFAIKNIGSNMVLSPQSKPPKSGLKIVQTQFTNQPQQKWKIVKEGANKFLIKNMADPTLIIGVPSKKEGMGLVLTTETEKAIWRLEGSVPEAGIEKNNIDVQMEQM